MPVSASLSVTCRLLPVVLAAILSAAASLRAEAPTAEAADAPKATVAVLVYDAQGALLRKGAGFFASRAGDVITDFHLVRGASRAEVKTRDGKTLAVKSVVAEDLDVGVVRLATDGAGDVPFLEPSREGVAFQETMIVLPPPPADEPVTVQVHLLNEVMAPTADTLLPLSLDGDVPDATGCPVIQRKGQLAGAYFVREAGGRKCRIAYQCIQPFASRTHGPVAFAEWSARYGKEWETTTEGINVEGLTLLVAKHASSAAKRFRKAVETSPESAKAWTFLSCGLMGPEAADEALAAAENGVKFAPNDPFAHYVRGRALTLLNRRKEALDSLHKATQLKDDFLMAHYWMVQSLLSSGRLAEGVDELGKVLSLHPKLYKQQWDYANLCTLRNVHRYREAAHGFAVAGEGNYDFHPYHYMYACGLQNIGSHRLAREQFLLEKPIVNNYAGEFMGLDYNLYHFWWESDLPLGRWSEMVDVCRSALKAQEGSYPVTFLGWAYLGLGRMDDAQTQILIEKWKDFDRQHCGLAWVALERGQHSEALTQFGEALRVNAVNVSAFVGSGVACRESGRLDEAARYFEKALCIDPMNADAHYHLGLTYLALGNLKAARGHARALGEVDSALASDLLQKISE